MRPDGTPNLIGLRRSAAYLPELEALRGIAVALVFLMHFDGHLVMPWYRAEPPSALMAFVRTDRAGVDLFFVLSGFLLSLPFLAQAAGADRVDVRRYFERRALRILPLYWTAVVAGTLLSMRHPADLLRGVPSLAFLDFSGSPLHPYGDVWWSLSTEVQFYLVLPLVGLLPRTRAGTAIGIAFLGIYAVAYTAFSRQIIALASFGAQLRLQATLFGRAPLFLCGILAAVVYRGFGDSIRAALARSAWMRNGSSDILLGGVLFAFGSYLRWETTLGAARQAPWFQWLDFVSGAAWSIVLLALLLAPLRLKTMLVNPVMIRLGVLSYSIYLIHLPLMEHVMPFVRETLGVRVLRWEPRAIVPFACVTVLCLGMSMLTYRLIERPFLARKRRLGT